MKHIKIKSDIVDDDTGTFYEWFGLSAAYPAQVERILAEAAKP